MASWIILATKIGFMTIFFLSAFSVLSGNREADMTVKIHSFVDLGLVEYYFRFVYVGNQVLSLLKITLV